MKGGNEMKLFAIKKGKQYLGRNRKYGSLLDAKLFSKQKDAKSSVKQPGQAVVPIELKEI